MSGKELLRLLQRHGWYLARIKGSHYIMAHADRPGVILPVPGHGREVATGTAHAILRKAGLK